jgi:hypothetical protein
VSKTVVVPMRNRLTTAALISFLSSIVNVSTLDAQLAQPLPSSAARSLGYTRGTLGYTRAPLSNDVARLRTAIHRHRHASRKRHPLGSEPNLRKVAERQGYKRVSDLVNFPKFFPGLGIIFVKAESLPIGPFLCFDRKDRLVATVYMVPIKDINDHKSFDAPGFAGRADHVSLYLNPGHPGVDVPHYHFVIWHVSKKQEAGVAK